MRTVRPPPSSGSNFSGLATRISGCVFSKPHVPTLPGTFASDREIFVRKQAPNYQKTSGRFRFLFLQRFFYAGVIDAVRRLASTMPLLNRSMSMEGPMRDSMFMMAPVALIIYFLIYPDQFNALLAWAGQHLH
jgi:hypothetical protein